MTSEKQLTNFEPFVPGGKSRLFIALLALSIVATAASVAPKLPPGAKVFIVPNNGFETFLSAALEKKKVPVVIVATKEAADYTIDSTSESQKAGWAKTIFINPRSDEEASIRILKNSSNEVVFAYAVSKNSSVHGKQSTAEACAKHLKEAMKEK